jgi:hypothetical protein
VPVASSYVCLLCNFDQGDAHSLIAHVKEHAAEANEGELCLFPDCDAAPDECHALVRHLLHIHYHVRWKCAQCDEIYDLRDEALMCSHVPSQKSKAKKRAKTDTDAVHASPPALSFFGQPPPSGPVLKKQKPVPAPPFVSASPSMPRVATMADKVAAQPPDERKLFAEKIRQMMSHLGLASDRHPSWTVLREVPEELPSVSERELHGLLKGFVETQLGTPGIVHALDAEWRSFWQEQKKGDGGASAAAARRGSSHAGPGRRQVMPPSAPRIVLTAPSLVMNGSVNVVPPVMEKVGVENVLICAKRTVVLLDESDQQLRHAVNLLAAARRRISDLDNVSRVSKKKIAELNQQLIVAQTQNRDLRVKMLYDDREHHRQIDRLVRESKEGSAISLESASAIGQLKELKQELVLLLPVFTELLLFENVDLLFVQSNGMAERVGSVRCTRDLSGKRWLVWSDLKASSSSSLLAILNQPDALPPMTEGTERRLMERILCFRPFAIHVTGASKVEKDQNDVLVSWDWPRFGGGLEEKRKEVVQEVK